MTNTGGLNNYLYYFGGLLVIIIENISQDPILVMQGPT